MFNFLRCIRSAEEDADGKRIYSAHLLLDRAPRAVRNTPGRSLLCVPSSPSLPSLHVVMCVRLLRTQKKVR